MTDTLPDVNLDPPDDITGEYEEEYDENGNVIELDTDDIDVPDEFEDDRVDENILFGGRDYP